MNTNRMLKRIVSILLILSIVVTATGCSFTRNETSETGQVINDNNTIVVDNVEINDSFVALEIKSIENVSLDLKDIDIDKILINCIEVTSIDTIEVEVTSINDEFVYLAYKNFVSVYGDDFDLKDFLIDAGIGAGCILVCVTLSVAGGPIGTYFGAIITSQFTTSAIVVGTAIDAAVSAYQAYEEGGDVSYIIGHILNGVVDGFKWSAMLAPLTGAIDGIKALRAVSELRELPGFEEITDKQAKKIFQEFAEILRKTNATSSDLTDNAIKDLYKSLSKDIANEIPEDMIRNVLENRSQLTDIVRKFNPFNVSREVVQAMQDNFLKNTGLSNDLGRDLVKNIKNGTIKSLDDITDQTAREYIEKNLYEFVEYFGNSFTDDFIDNCMRVSMGEDVFDLVKKSIISNNLYIDLVEKIGKDGAEKLLSDSNTVLLMQLRYGTQNVNKLLNAHDLYKQMLKKNVIPNDQLKEVLNGLLDGTYKSLDDISKVNVQIAKNLCSSREVVASCIRSLGNDKALSGLLDDMAREGFKSLNLSSSAVDDLIRNYLTKSDIISKYGNDMYYSLLENYNFSVSCLNVQAKLNTSLLGDITIDTLKQKGIPDRSISEIMKGCNISEWGLADDEVFRIWNTVADYYQITDNVTYCNYVSQIAELRGEYILSFIVDYKAAGNTLINAEKYSGRIMEPSGSNAVYIKAKYGEIRMSKKGFVILDNYAVARVELPDLTGLSGGAEDIARANVLHHGTQMSIPGYTWHHLEDGKTLILVPTELHEAYKHTGGADLLREGLKEAIDDRMH